MLAGAGCRVETAGTCQEAVEKCRQSDFDAITLDLVLPDGSGWDVLRSIRSLPRFRSTPVIVVSGIEEQQVVMPEPVQGFLTKPITPDQLLDALERAGVTTRWTVGAR
jgi:CheY-like chemotaxis protein